MHARKSIWGIFAGVLALALVPTAAAAAPAVSGEFQVSKLGANNKIVAGPDGKIWATLSDATNDVAQIEPKTGEVKEFNLGPAVKEPLGIAVANGEIWITSEGILTHFDPANTAAHESLPLAGIGATSSIVAGPDGNLWVATEGKLLRFPPGNGKAITDNLKEISVAGLNPRDIDVAGGELAIADRGGSRVLLATPAKAANGEFIEDKVAGGVQGVAGAPNGQVAFTEGTEYGLITPPQAPQLTPAVGLDSFGAALGPDGAFWIAQAFGSESVVRLDSRNKSTTLTPGFAKGSHPRQLTAGPENTLWVTLEGNNKVGRVSGVVAPEEPPTETEPRTALGKGPKARVTTRKNRAPVKFSFSSPDVGAAFQCRMVRIAKAAKPPAFAACRSPKTYRLAAGRYRFEVRAVLSGVADKSPASRSFKVVRLHP